MTWGNLLTEEYMEIIFKFAGLGVFLGDLEGNCVFTNVEWQNLSGQTFEKASGRGWLDIVLEDDASMLYTIFEKAKSDPSAGFTFEYRIRHCNKGIVFLKASLRVQVIANTSYFLGCVQDITNLRSTEQEILTSNPKPKYNEAENDMIFEALVHDLRNQIVGIRALTEYLVKNESFEKKIIAMLKLIMQASSQSFEMINSLVASRIDANVKQAFRKKTDLTSLLKCLVERLQLKADEKSQSLLLDAPRSVCAYLDPDKISRVFEKLIINAIKFSPEGTQISVFVAKFDNKTTISVKDRGAGIPFDLRSKIFELFNSGKRSDEDRGSSFGSGLTLCKQIIEAHGGKIWFNTSLTNGTTFYVELS